MYFYYSWGWNRYCIPTFTLITFKVTFSTSRPFIKVGFCWEGWGVHSKACDLLPFCKALSSLMQIFRLQGLEVARAAQKCCYLFVCVTLMYNTNPKFDTVVADLTLNFCSYQHSNTRPGRWGDSTTIIHHLKQDSCSFHFDHFWAILSI